MGSELVAVVELGGGHASAALFDPRRPLETKVRRIDLDSSAPAEQILLELSTLLESIAVPSGAEMVVAVPGPFDYEKGIGDFSGVAKFGALQGVNLREGLLAVSDTTEHIYFVNDADAFGLGAATLAHRNEERVLCITLGTGVGSAFVDHGRIVADGPHVPPGGEIHLIKIAGRPLEDVVSTRALRRSYRELTGRELAVVDIAGRALDGEVAANTVLLNAFDALGEALGEWILRFGATRLIVGGAIARSWEIVHPALAGGLRRLAPIAIERCTNDELAPFIGAAQAIGYLVR